MQSQGTASNLKGMRLEDQIQCAMQALGYYARKRHQTDWVGILNSRIVLSCYLEPPGAMLFGSSTFPRGLAINALSQDSDGSGAYKIGTMVLNAQYCYKAPAVLVLEGNAPEMIGARSFAKQQLGTFLDGSPSNIVGVFTMSEFRNWLKLCDSQGELIKEWEV